MDDARVRREAAVVTVVAVAVAIVLAAVALAGCGRAGAAGEQTSGIATPAGWQALPQIAAAAKEALGARAVIDGAEAWGEPAMGCYAVWLALRAEGSAEAVGKQVIDGFTAAGSAGSAGGAGSAGDPANAAALVVRDVAAPAGDEGVLALAFERGEHRGRLRARLGGGTIAALACFANQREPGACEPACAKLLEAIK
jgi:hypothetical protein